MDPSRDDFLHEEILGLLYDAEDQKDLFPATALHNIGRCLEMACRSKTHSIQHDTHIHDLLNEPDVRRALAHLIDDAQALAEASNAAMNNSDALHHTPVEPALASLRKILLQLGFQLEESNEEIPSEHADPPPGNADASFSRISPPWEVINAWSDQMALTPGERFLVELFDNNLSDDWLIYVQPHFLGLRPDIILLNTKQQVIHIEVKDWSLSNLYWTKYGLRDRSYDGPGAIRQNPIEQTELVRKRFLDGPLSHWNANRRPNTILKSFLYLHSGTKTKATDLFHKRGEERHILVVHHDDVRKEGVTLFTTSSTRQFGGPDSEPALRSLTSYLGEPEYVHDQIVPQPAQRRLCLTKWDRISSQPGLFDEASDESQPIQTFERIRGGAGAGKSHIVALRAARAAQAGKNVLITSLNITMGNYLQGLVRRATTKKAHRDRIVVRHLHGFMTDQRIHAGINSEIQSTPEFSIPQLVDILFDRQLTAPEYVPPMLDAIYVDEGQDFAPEDIKAVSRFLAPDGELVLFADGRQDVYNKLRQWKRLPVPFKPWRQLNGGSKRLPDCVSGWLNVVAEKIKLGDEDDRPLMPAGGVLPNLNDSGFPMWWADLSTDIEAIEATPLAIRLIQKVFQNVHPSDIALLTLRRDIGLRIFGRITYEYGENTVKHVFGDNLIRERHGDDSSMIRKQKLAFHQADGRYKACTIHSFKGWESLFVILVWTSIGAIPEEERGKIASIFYTGSSRCRKGMVILNSDSEFKGFRDERWSDFWAWFSDEEVAQWRQDVQQATPLRRPQVFDPFADDPEALL